MFCFVCCFPELYSGNWYIDGLLMMSVCICVKGQKIRLFVKLIYCSVSEHEIFSDSFKLLKSKKILVASVSRESDAVKKKMMMMMIILMTMMMLLELSCANCYRQLSVYCSYIYIH